MLIDQQKQAIPMHLTAPIGTERPRHYATLNAVLALSFVFGALLIFVGAVVLLFKLIEAGRPGWVISLVPSSLVIARLLAMARERLSIMDQWQIRDLERQDVKDSAGYTQDQLRLGESYRNLVGGRAATKQDSPMFLSDQIIATFLERIRNARNGNHEKPRQ